MYRGPSPIFDVPEFPALRRVKPLPKRRRMLPSPSHPHDALASADTLSARMALQNYYLPMLGGVQDFLASAAGLDAAAAKELEALDFGIHFAGGMGGGGGNDRMGIGNGGGNGGGGLGNMGIGTGRDEEDEDDHGDGDYIDHLQQPGNTKKRKVPVHASGSPREARGEDEPTDRGIPTGRAEPDGGDASPHSQHSHGYNSMYPLPTPLGVLARKEGKLTAATMAGMQHKEMLKSRKRQLAAVLGALSHGDTLALDQALSANYPFASGLSGGFDDVRGSDPPRVRLSKRMTVRMMRAARIRRQPRHPDAVPLPSSEFFFSCASATADRLTATKEEVAMLRNRFEAELERQAAKAVKLAAASKMMSMPSSKSRTKRSDRARAIVGGEQPPTHTQQQHAQATTEFVEQTLGSLKPRGKKKKRSALANASNPHHLRNYVPSRLPHSSGVAGGMGQQVNPDVPLRFLSAEIPPRRRKKMLPVAPVQLTNPADEWICSFCEHDLFYGDDSEYRRAVRNRKKILKRRRRARERAAAAASGNSVLKTGMDRGGDEYDSGFEPALDEFVNVPKTARWKGEGNKGERVGELASGYG